MTEEYQTLDLVNVARGAAVEQFEEELQRVTDNIRDINTPATEKREIVLKFTFKPNSERNFATVVIEAKSKLAAVNGAAGECFIGVRHGKNIAVPNNPEQMQMEFDEESKPRSVSEKRKATAGE